MKISKEEAQFSIEMLQPYIDKLDETAEDFVAIHFGTIRKYIEQSEERE